MASLGSLSVTVGAAIDGFEKSMGTVSQRLNAIDREATKAFSGFEKVGDRLTTIGTGLTAAITLPLLGAAVAATKFASDFELGMRQVTSLLGGATAKEFDALSKRTLDLARVMGIDAVKASNALYEAISAGVPKENAIDFLAVASKAAIAGVTDTRVAVDALTTIIAAYGLKFEDATKVSDALFQAVNVGKFKFEELAKSIGPAAAQAKNLGISYEELLAATSTLSITSGGVSIAVTQIESAMRALLQPTKEMQIALKSIGFETGEAAVKTLGFEGLLNKLREQTGGSAAAFNALFGRIEGYNAAIGLTGDRSAAAAKDLATLRNSTGAADKAFQEIDKTTARQFERLTSELKTTAIELGTKLLPSVNELLKAMRPLVGIIGEAVEWFTTLPAPVQAVGLGLAAVAIAAGPVVLVLGQIISTLVTVLPALTSLGGAMTTFITTQAPAMVTGTGTIATAISALGSAAVLTAGVFVGWKLGSWAYEQIPGFKALGDALAESLLVIPGVEAAVRGLSGASAAAAVAIDTSEFAIKKQEEALKRLGIVLNKEGISTEEYAKRLRETVQQQIAMTSQTKKVDTEVKKTNRTMKDAGLSAEDHAKATKEANKHTRDFADIQPVLAAKLKIVEGEYRKNVAELARMQLAMEKAGGTVLTGAAQMDQLALASERLGAEIGHLGTEVKNLPQLPGFTGRIAELDAVGKAYERLGVTSTGELKRIANAHLTDFNTIKNSGIATAKELEQGFTKWADVAVDAAHQAGEQIPADIAALFGSATEKTKKGTEEQKTLWGDFGKSVSTVITNFAQDISKSLWDGDISWGQKGKDLLKSLGQSVTSLFIEPATAALSKFITGVLADLIGGKGFGGVITSAKELGSTIAGVFGAGSSAAGAAGSGAKTAGDIAGVASAGGGNVGSAAGSVAGAGAGAGATAVVGAVGAVVSAVSDVIGNFQMAGINKSLDLIEHEVRFSQLHLKEILGRGVNEFLSQLPNINDRLFQFVGNDSWRIHDVWDRLGNINDLIAFDTNSILAEIRDAIRAPRITAQLEGVTGGASITITGNIFRNRDDIDYMLGELRRNL